MKAIIIPGNCNTDISQFWYPSLKKFLEENNIEVIAENMPDPDLARKEYWLPSIEEKTNGDKNTILIGHSSGAVAIMRYLETHEIEGAVLIGTCYTNLNDEKEMASGYYDDPWLWDKINRNAKWIIQFASTDDPFVPVEEARHIKNQLNTEYYEYSNRGHFMETEFPELIEILGRKLTLIKNKN